MIIRTVLSDRTFAMAATRENVAGWGHIASDWRPISGRMADDQRPELAHAHLIDGYRDAASHGLSLAIDLTPPGAGRDALLMRRVADASGIGVVVATGSHIDPVRLARIETRTVEALAEWFAFEISTGVMPITGDSHEGIGLVNDQAIGRATDALNTTPVRAGIIRITIGDAPLSSTDRKLVEAAAIASAAMGAATVIVTHSPDAFVAAARRFTGAGGSTRKLIHARGIPPEVPTVFSTSEVLQVLDTGANLALDPRDGPQLLTALASEVPGRMGSVRSHTILMPLVPTLRVYPKPIGGESDDAFSDPEVPVTMVTGNYEPPATNNLDERFARQLWANTERIVSLDTAEPTA
ncbi:MAG: hypothetical protein EXR45_00705 [Chloroflexi bacterium]|nr:hypothetical protein [Chloroflexota bacterium]